MLLTNSLISKALKSDGMSVEQDAAWNISYNSHYSAQNIPCETSLTEF